MKVALERIVEKLNIIFFLPLLNSFQINPIPTTEDGHHILKGVWQFGSDRLQN